MAALVDPTGLYSALVSDLYKQGRSALLDVINLERNGKQLKEGCLDDLLSLAREVLARYDNPSTSPYVLRMLKDLCSFVEDMSKRVSTKQSWNPFERWSAAQKIEDARNKLEQFLHKVTLICLLLNGQDMAAMTTQLNGISTKISTLTIQAPKTELGTQHLQLGRPPASSSRFNILALPPPNLPPVGISEETSTLNSWLFDEGGAQWISVSGMGGIGKSFLVRAVCRLAEVRRHFQDRILWVRLGTTPRVPELHRDLCEAISGRETRLLPSPEDGHNVLCSLASGQRYLVVLDDAWLAPDSPMMAHRGLESLNFLDTSNGSRIVVTSRNRSILDRLGVQHRHLELHGFSDDNSYTLFCNHAFNAEEAPSDLEKYARDLAGRCGGVPFVLEVLGKAMRSKRQPAQWKYMLDKLSRGVLDERARILELLRLSYDQLSTVQQRRFLALVILDSLEIPGHFRPIAWQSMDLLQLDKCIDGEVARCAFNEALEELVSYSLAPSHPYLGQNQWIKELAWHIVKEEMQSLEQQVESEEQNQEDGDNSSTYFKVAVISESLVISEQFKSPAVPSSLRLLMAHDTKLLQTREIKSAMVLPSLGLLMGTKLLKSNIDKLLQLRFLHLDVHCESRIASIGELSELFGLRLRIRGMGDIQHYGKIEEALGNLVKMEDLELSMDDCSHEVDLRFLRRMPNLRYLKIAARRATSGSNIKHCLRMRSLRLQVHLADAQLNDLLHPESSLERALIESMPRESASGYNGFIPATLKFFYVTRWTSGDTKSSLSEPVFSSCEIIKLSMCLPMESLPESFGRLHSLQQLSLDGCGVLAHLTSLDRFPELHGLFLKNCAMPRLGILFLPVLRTLEVFNCESLVEIQGIDAPKLKELRIFNCKSLVEIREINAPELSTLQVDGCDALVQIQGLTTPSAVPAEWYGHSSSSSTQLQHISCASPFSNLVSLTISLARESLPECLSQTETLAKLQWLSLDGRDSLLQLPSFASLPRLSGLWLDNCAVQCLPLAAGPPGFPALEFLAISRFRCMVKIQGLYATHLRGLHLKDCPSLVEIQDLDCPGLRRVDQSQLGGGGYFPDLPWHNQAATIYRQGNAGNTSGL